MFGRYMASACCSRCGGEGTTNLHPCRCVYRGMFRECYKRYLYCRDLQVVCCVERIQRGGGYVVGFKSSEYVTDFEQVGRRSLPVPVENAVFRFHFLAGADWKLCYRQLGINRGEFFHVVYRVEERLGRVFAELKPYALWPVNEYFAGQRMNLREMDKMHTAVHLPENRRTYAAIA